MQSLNITETFTTLQCFNTKHFPTQRGKLDVVADDGRDIYVTLGDGAVFGEVPDLEIGDYGIVVFGVLLCIWRR